MQRPIYLLSPEKKEAALALPMIEFKTLVDDIDFSLADTLMFTSKQAVKTAESVNPSWKKLPCLAIGAATKKQIETLGGNVVHQPESFYAKVLSQDIIRKFKEKKILYLRPKVVSFDSKTFLHKAGLHLEEKVIYETSCLSYAKKEAPRENAIIIFTSPSTIHCFLKNFSWHESYTAVVIGEATKKHLPQQVACKVADKPTIDACIAKAQSISNSK
ncbi:MAG: uroporphyrinogen-III synthase [Sulfurovum sp.]|nr:uroporphyrinogen-III synthase [Sulfurovum sp.]